MAAHEDERGRAQARNGYGGNDQGGAGHARARAPTARARGAAHAHPARCDKCDSDRRMRQPMKSPVAICCRIVANPLQPLIYRYNSIRQTPTLSLCRMCRICLIRGCNCDFATDATGVVREREAFRWSWWGARDLRGPGPPAVCPSHPRKKPAARRITP
jgi:hypothetical protein